MAMRKTPAWKGHRFCRECNRQRGRANYYRAKVSGPERQAYLAWLAEGNQPEEAGA